MINNLSFLVNFILILIILVFICKDMKKENFEQDFLKSFGPTNHNKLSKNVYPKNMTLQDYVNWLLQFKDDKKSLSKEHLVNLEKILRGERITYKPNYTPPPTKVSPPMTSKAYFSKLYINNPRIAKPLNNITDGLMPANINEYVDFKKNFDVYGTSGRIDLNPDLVNKKDIMPKTSLVI